MEREDPQWTPVFSWKEMCLQYPFRLPVSRWSFRQKSMSKAFSILMLNLGLGTDSALSSWLKRKEKTNHLQIQDRTWSSLDALQNNTILIWKWTQARTLVSYLYKRLMLIIVLWHETTLVLEKWASVSGSSIFHSEDPERSVHQFWAGLGDSGTLCILVISQGPADHPCQVPLSLGRTFISYFFFTYISYWIL